MAQRGRAGHGELVGKPILLAAFNGQKLPYLEIPLYLWCRAFDKMYDWYANDNIFTELTSFIPQHLIHKFNKLRYGHAQNPKKEVGSVGWDQWAHYMQAMHFDETNTVVEHFKMLYPCAQCGNMDADAEYHGGDLSMVCGCGIGKQDTSSTKMLVHEAFEEFWTSITGDGNQHLFLKLITGGSFAGPAETTISIAFKSYVHYTDITKDVKELEEYAQKLCEENENEAAYL